MKKCSLIVPIAADKPEYESHIPFVFRMDDSGTMYCLKVHLECASQPTDTPKRYTALSRKWNLQSQALYFKKRLPRYKYVLYRIISLFSAPLYLRRYYSAAEKRMLMRTLLCPFGGEKK